MLLSHFHFFFSNFKDFWKTETAKKRGILSASEQQSQRKSTFINSFTIWVGMWWQMGERGSNCALSLSLCLVVWRITSNYNFALSLASFQGRLQLFLRLGVKICTWRFSEMLSFNQSCALLTRDFHCCDLRGKSTVIPTISTELEGRGGVQHRGTGAFIKPGMMRTEYFCLRANSRACSDDTERSKQTLWGRVRPTQRSEPQQSTF